MALLDIKEGDRVFCINYGWGTVTRLSNVMLFPIGVKFDEINPIGITNWYDMQGRLYEFMKPTLSFTEYTLEGFNQERPEELPEVGQIVWGKTLHNNDWNIGHYLGRLGASYKISSTPNAISYWEAIKITTKNPYAK